MMKSESHFIVAPITIIAKSSSMESGTLKAVVYETSEGGNKLRRMTGFPRVTEQVEISIIAGEKYQVITGIGGSFTKASAHLLNQLSRENRTKILEAYFGESGARYSLTRTHMNSCDFSLGNYSYAPVKGDLELEHFSIEEDMDDLIPMIKEAMAISRDGFRIIASPWTAPPWMKDNNDWRGGRLLPEYYDTWALFFSRYIDAYRRQGIEIWGFTVENEPLGNNCNWESMHFTPGEMNEFVKHHLGPRLRADGHETIILGYDQNRNEELIEWIDAMYDDEKAARHYDGTAVHWYGSTFSHFPDALQYARNKAPGRHLIQSEACIDNEVPRWQDDPWYWSGEATDWGYHWAPPQRKHLHPRYVPVFRYANDIIGCLNNWVDGWIDWNMLLNRQGGPNWAENWCIAPVIVDPEKDEVYFTPLYYTMAHFSRYIRPGAVRIGFENTREEIKATAVENPDGTIAVVIFNPLAEPKGVKLSLSGQSLEFSISAKALQTIVI